MKKDITLLILAAGMGSRFGGLKQIEPMGPNDEFIIDYSVYDAIKAGFTKIVFLIKEENYQLFKDTIGKRVEPHIKVEYCFQKNNNIPKGYEIPSTRVKPLGTAHAILCAKDLVHEPFAIINADDFYGRDAIVTAANFLKKMKDVNTYGVVGYMVKNTITEHGSVKRGVCVMNDNQLTGLIESSVERIDGTIIAKPLNGNEPFKVADDDLVSMNLLLFNPSIFEYIEKRFPIFLDENKDNIEKAEFLIPDVLFDAIKEDYAKVTMLKTTSNWYGVTYKEDTDLVRSSLKELTLNGEYNNHLWEENN